MIGKFSRRDFLRMTAIGAAAAVAGCGAPPTEVPTGVPTEVSEEPTAAPKPVVQLEHDPRRYLMDPLIDPPRYYEPMLTITQNKVMNQGMVFREGETIEDNVGSRYIKAIMGIDYKIAWACKGETCDQAWATMLASGDIPDYLEWVAGQYLGQLMAADLLQDLTDLFPKYASALTLKKKEWPDSVIWKPLTRDGRIYGIAFPNMGVAALEMLLWVRKDWLDRLGLSMPGTLDEIYDVAKAFIQEGLAPIGLSAAGESGVVDWQSSLDPIFGAFGVMPTYWLKDDKGGLVYGSTLPENKEALQVLQKWYKDGVLEAEFMTKGAAKAAENIAGNIAGMFFGPYWTPEWPLVDSARNDPSVVWDFGDVPAGPDGTRGRAGFKMAYFGSCFRKGVEEAKVEAVINHLNWIYDMREASPLGDHWQIEGYDYVIENGEAKTGQFDTTVMEPGPGYPTYYYPAMAADKNAKIEILLKKDPQTLNPVERWRVSDPTGVAQRAAYARIIETLDYALTDEYVGPPTPTQTEKGAFLDKLEDEAYIQIITGQRGISEHDRFVEEWKANGGDQLTQEVNEWYASL